MALRPPPGKSSVSQPAPRSSPTSSSGSSRAEPLPERYPCAVPTHRTTFPTAEAPAPPFQFHASPPRTPRRRACSRFQPACPRLSQSPRPTRAPSCKGKPEPNTPSLSPTEGPPQQPEQYLLRKRYPLECNSSLSPALDGPAPAPLPAPAAIRSPRTRVTRPLPSPSTSRPTPPFLSSIP